MSNLVGGREHPYFIWNGIKEIMQVLSQMELHKDQVIICANTEFSKEMVIFVGNATDDPDTLYYQHVAQHGRSFILAHGSDVIPIAFSTITNQNIVKTSLYDIIYKKKNKIALGTHAIQIQCDSGHWNKDPVTVQIRKFL